MFNVVQLHALLWEYTIIAITTNAGTRALLMYDHTSLVTSL